MTYLALPHQTIRQKEIDVQENDWDNNWKVGEWFNLSYPNDWNEIENATYTGDILPRIHRMAGEWHRTLEQRRVLRREIDLWMELGLVSDVDIAFNHLLGLVDENDLPI